MGGSLRFSALIQSVLPKATNAARKTKELIATYVCGNSLHLELIIIISHNNAVTMLKRFERDD